MCVLIGGLEGNGSFVSNRGRNGPVFEAKPALAQSASVSPEAWRLLALQLRGDVGPRAFEDWIRPLSFFDYCAPTGVVTLHSPSAFAANWITERYLDRISLALRTAHPDVKTVRIVPVPQALAQTAFSAAIATKASRPANDSPATGGSVALPVRTSGGRVQNFANFVVGKSNILARNAAMRMAAAEAPQFSPLFLQSTTGQGKTHLMQAIAHDFAIAHPGASVLYMSAERFMTDYVSAVRGHDMVSFKDRLRNADMLLVDDLQFIMNKGGTQEELLLTLDALMVDGKRLVLAADRAPHLFDGVDQRLLSRLSGGLVAEIDAPDAPLRRAILEQRRATLDDVHVPDDVLDFLAANVTRNVRELEGAFNKLVGYASLADMPVDLDLARLRLAEMVRSSKARITIDDIQRAVCAHYRLERGDMASARRVRSVARPRQVAMYLAKTLTSRSYPEIGRKFGGRDHSTVIHAIRTIEDLRLRDRDLDSDINRIRRVLEM